MKTCTNCGHDEGAHSARIRSWQVCKSFKAPENAGCGKALNIGLGDDGMDVKCGDSGGYLCHDCENAGDNHSQQTKPSGRDLVSRDDADGESFAGSENLQDKKVDKPEVNSKEFSNALKSSGTNATEGCAKCYEQGFFDALKKPRNKLLHGEMVKRFALKEMRSSFIERNTNVYKGCPRK